MSATCSCVLNHEAGHLHCHPSTLAAALLVFLAAAAGAGVITANLRLAGGRMRGHGAGGRGRLGIERQPEMLKDRLAPVENPALAHLTPVTHDVHRHEIMLDEVQHFER